MVEVLWATTAVVVAGVALAGIPQARAATSGPGPSPVAVTPTLPPTAAFQQPWLAVDPAHPTHMALAYQDGNRLQECYLALSTDSGATWGVTAFAGSQGGFPPAAGTVHCDNPRLAFGPHGALYYVFQDSGFRRLEPTALNVFIAVSRDGGAHFDPPHTLDPAASAPNDWYPDVTVDYRTGRVYVAWARYVTNFTAFPGWILVQSSTDGARSFSTPVRIDPPRPPQYVGGPFMAVEADGTLLVSFLPGSRVVSNKFVPTADALQVAVSADSGRTFVSRSIDAIVKACVGVQGPCDKLVPFSNAESIVAGSPRGTAYLTWWDDRGPGNLPRIVFCASHDDGRTWATPRTLDAPAGNPEAQLFSPSVSVAPDGRIDLAYYGLAAGLIRAYRSSSTDGGATFSAPVVLDTRPSPAKVGPSAGPRLMASFGSYLAVASSAGRAFVAWTDSSRGNLTTGHQDVFFAGQRLAGGGGGFPVWGYVLAATAILVAMGLAGVTVARRRRGAGAVDSPAPTG